MGVIPTVGLGALVGSSPQGEKWGQTVSPTSTPLSWQEAKLYRILDPQ